MAKILKQSCSHLSPNNDSLKFDYDVSVTTDGFFTTTIPETAVEKLKQFDVTLRKNRMGREGFFESDTLAGLTKIINDFVAEAMSVELVSSERIIRYDFWCAGDFVLDGDDRPVPNGRFTDAEQSDLYFRQLKHFTGTEFICSNGPVPIGVQLYAVPFLKETYRYKSGKEYSKYKPQYQGFEQVKKEDPEYNWKFLSALCCQARPKHSTYQNNKTQFSGEILYTEEKAGVFVKIIQGLMALSYQLSVIANPDMIEALSRQSEGPLRLPQINSK